MSIVVPAHNAVAFIGDTLESLRRQTVAPTEIIVVDDGSTDGTADLVRARFPEVKLVTQRNLGAAAARNAGIAAADGDLIGFIDADDRWLPHAVERLAERLRRSPDSVAVVYAWSTFIDAKGRRIGDSMPSFIEGIVWTTLASINFLGNASATIVRRSALEAVGCFDTTYRTHDASGCEDWDLYLRLAEQFQFVVVPEYLVEYRKLPGSMTVAAPDGMARSHARMHDCVIQRGLRISSLVRRLSYAIFYQYLAAECQRHGSFRISGFWLAKAARHGAPWTFLLPGFHACVVKQLLKVRTVSAWRSSSAGAKRVHAGLRLDPMLLRFLHVMLTKTFGQQPRLVAPAQAPVRDASPEFPSALSPTAASAHASGDG